MIKIICTIIGITAAVLLLIAAWLFVAYLVTSPPAPVNLNDTPLIDPKIETI